MNNSNKAKNRKHIRQENIKVQKYNGFSIGILLKKPSKELIILGNHKLINVLIKNPNPIVNKPIDKDSNNIRLLVSLCELYLKKEELVKIK